ncbi:MAG: diaminopimelate epimerase [Epsilonproteobacteria bacterium]|jgi:diaminopimelate epimerase|nr:diaminopimelate epimerase [Campylobacterota bacterium]NPA89446.1 diaminopimelate epimerase [Campylobacterota bacterium]
MFFCAKYSASGNDFVITHTFKAGNPEKRGELAKEICNRFSGIGADGFIILLPPDREGFDFRWEFYNSDGSIAEMCGNGSRATAHYAYRLGLAGREMRFLTLAGPIWAKVEEGDWVETQLTPHKLLKGEFSQNGRKWWLWDTGVPHLVTLGESVEEFDKEIAREMRWAHNSNVNFGAVTPDGKLLVRTFERGVEDETLACGTGMCATFLTARELGLVGDKVEVYPKSGERLEISLIDNRLHFAGRVTPTFETQWQGKI